MDGVDSLPVTPALLQGQSGGYGHSRLDFKDLLRKIADRFASKKALADAMEMDPSRLSRALNTGDFPFNVANCLRLAKVSGEPASEVLRAAGKTEIADLIESLYGVGRQGVLSDEEREIIEAWRRLEPRIRESYRTLLLHNETEKVPRESSHRPKTFRPTAASVPVRRRAGK